MFILNRYALMSRKRSELSFDQRHSLDPNISAPFATINNDIIQLLIEAADPETAMSLCQVNRKTRSVCLNKLSLTEKIRIGFDSIETARKSDLIPLFSRGQFLKLIPENLASYSDTELTHDLYLRKYKLSSEGYSTAIYKARLMNTICALLRPRFLFDTIGKLTLPVYVDTSLIDRSFKYREEIDVIDRSEEPLDEYQPYIQAFLGGEENSDVAIDLDYSKDLHCTGASIRFCPGCQENQAKVLRTFTDDPILCPFGRFIVLNYESPGAVWVEVSEDNSNLINPFVISRFLKAAFDLRFLDAPYVVLEDALYDHKVQLNCARVDFSHC